MSRAAKTRYNLLIGGGGFVGLAMAKAIASTGLDLEVALIDRASLAEGLSATFDGRASALSLASVKMLQYLGIWDEVADAAQPVTDIDITDSPLEAPIRPVFLHFDNRVQVGEPASFILENHLLRRAFAKAVRDLPGVTLIEQARVQDFGADSRSAWLHLSDGRALEADLVVAADGRNSVLRKLAGIKTVSWSYPQTGIIATVALERDHRGRAVQHFLPAGPFAILPLKGRRASLVWTESRKQAKRIMALEEAAFLKELTRRFGHKLGILQLAGPRQSWPLSLIMARDFTANRLALIGDAAHGVHPIAGQGLNIGLRDVAALVEVIAETARLGLDIGGAVALERYQRWRRFDAASSAFVMDALNRLFSNDFEPLRLLRSTGLALVDRLPGLKQHLVNEAAGCTGELPRLLKGEPV